MAWTYADYSSQTSDSARLTRLRLHIDEVEAAVNADSSSTLGSASYSSLNAKLERLYKERARLEAKVGAVDSDSAQAKATFIRGFPR